MSISREYTVVVDFKSTDTIQTDITFKQYDYGTSTINFDMRYNGNQLFMASDEEAVVVLKCKKTITTTNNLNTFQAIRARSVELIGGNILSVGIPKVILKNYGLISCEIVIMNKLNGNRKTSPNVTFSIINSLLDFENLLEGQ